jgi:hypothetical protein
MLLCSRKTTTDGVTPGHGEVCVTSGNAFAKVMLKPLMAPTTHATAADLNGLCGGLCRA